MKKLSVLSLLVCTFLFSAMGVQAQSVEKGNTSMVCVFLRTNRHRKDLPSYNPSIVFPIAYPTSSSFTIIDSAHKALERIYKDGYQYKRAGVIITDISPSNSVQLNMFDGENPKHPAIMKVIDKINISNGNKIIRFGGQSLGRVWKMKQQRLSPSYTTDVNDIITVNCIYL